MIGDKTMAEVKFEKAVAEIAGILASTVEAIEADPVPTTQNHYGDYMKVLLQAPDADGRKIMALALLKAGANEQGVKAALAQVT